VPGIDLLTRGESALRELARASLLTFGLRTRIRGTLCLGACAADGCPGGLDRRLELGMCPGIEQRRGVRPHARDHLARCDDIARLQFDPLDAARHR
jgi:hypothetical protein